MQIHFFLTEKTCDGSTIQLGANQNFESGSAPSLEEYGTTAGIVCEQGFKWPDGSDNQLVTCQADSTWSQLTVACEGALHFPFLKYFP